MSQGPVPVALEALANDAPVRLRPLGLMSGGDAARAVALGLALPLAGGSLAFSALELLVHGEREIVSALAPLPRLRQWADALGPGARARIEERLAALSIRRAPWAGLALDRPLVMGIVNVTPDSFSDGGAFADPEHAVAHGRALLAAGADIIDIGGESTRPGAAPLAPDAELRRVEPVVRALAVAGAPVSIDTRHAAVMAAALAAGARIVNDVSALEGDRESMAVAARAGAAVVLMHMRGAPRTMQDDPRYELASLDVLDHLAARVAACAAGGIPRARLVVDPGIGFGKAQHHNLEILARLSLFHALGCGVLVGISRKSLVGGVTRAPVAQRLPGSLAGALHALAQGVQILRVHDVAETVQAVALWRGIADGAVMPPPGAVPP